VLAEYCAPHFATQCAEADPEGFAAKLDVLMEARNEQFFGLGGGRFRTRKGAAIFLWVQLPDNVNT